MALTWILATPLNGELACKLHCLSTAVLVETDRTWGSFILSHNIEKLQLFWVFIMKTRVCVKKNVCNDWKLVWLLTACTSYPPVLIMSVTVTAVCQWIGGSNLLPLVPCIPCPHPFYWFLHWAIFRLQNIIKHCCVISLIHFLPSYNAHFSLFPLPPIPCYPQLLCPCLPPLFSY